PKPSCMQWWWIDGNCLVTHCYQDEPGSFPEPRSITEGQVHQFYEHIESRCSFLRAGGDSVPESRNLGVNELAKRQNEDDDYFQILFQALGIRQPTDFERGPHLSNGVGYTWEVSESQTYSLTTSVSMGASWKIFSASVDAEVSESETFTVTEGLTFDVDCPSQAQITFYPLYDYYEVRSWPSETFIKIWIPAITGQRKVNGEISVACLG
ncbi:hypothetical protein BDW02DRAFT_485420, partial [Decorospora gaudefroyi]